MVPYRVFLINARLSLCIPWVIYLAKSVRCCVRNIWEGCSISAGMLRAKFIVCRHLWITWFPLMSSSRSAQQVLVIKIYGSDLLERRRSLGCSLSCTGAKHIWTFANKGWSTKMHSVNPCASLHFTNRFWQKRMSEENGRDLTAFCGIFSNQVDMHYVPTHDFS